MYKFSKEVYLIIQRLRKKKASLAQMIYINNRVLIPRLEYRMQLCLLPRSTCVGIQGPMLKLIKNKADLPFTTPNATFAHKNIVGATMLWQNQLTHHFTELLTRLNNKDEMGKATWM